MHETLFMPAATLIFPAVTPDAFEYASRCRMGGGLVIGAASVTFDTSKFDANAYLPSIHDDAFPECFADLLRQHSVTHIYAPISAVWLFLERHLRETGLSASLVNESPFALQARQYSDLLASADALRPFEQVIAGARSKLSRLQIAAILRQARLIHGESNEDKLGAIMGIFATAPRGDVVEIGSLLGRTAAVLRLLAGVYKTGSVLTVDPWEAAAAVQHDSPSLIQEMGSYWPENCLPNGFRINMMGLGSQQFFHLQLRSHVAFAKYASGKTFTDIDFTDFTPAGQIAVLHIDGNHDYTIVKQDIALWASRLAPGAWVIIDDYVWLHGDGPRRAGDEFLNLDGIVFESSFCCGKALFCKVTSIGK